jgi:formylglycine-generating enzyme required for sulfatase activity
VSPVGCSDEQPRVVRGGAWNNIQRNARAAYRNHNHPDNRNNNLGCRVCAASHLIFRGLGTPPVGVRRRAP